MIFGHIIHACDNTTGLLSRNKRCFQKVTYHTYIHLYYNCNETIEMFFCVISLLSRNKPMLSNLISPRPRGSRVRLAGKWIYNYLCNQCYITTNVVSSNLVHVWVYSIQHYVMQFVSDLRQVGRFLRVLWFSLPIKLTATI